MIAHSVLHPSRKVVLELVLRAAAVALMAVLILVLLPAIAEAAG